MQQRRITALVVGVALLAMLGAPSLAQAENLMATLAGTSEAPVCSTTGTGTFQATVNEDETSIAYTLTYDLDGTVQQAHIHLAQVGVSGGISVWLCQTPGVTPPTGPASAGTPTCPASPGTVTGTFTSANVIGPTSQGMGAGEFAELLGAMRKGLTYANVHSNLCPSGEVRGQIKKRRGG